MRCSTGPDLRAFTKSLTVMTLVIYTPSRLVNVNALMQNFSTSHVLRTNYFRQMLRAPHLIRVGLSCARVSQTFLKLT